MEGIGDTDKRSRKMEQETKERKTRIKNIVIAISMGIFAVTFMFLLKNVLQNRIYEFDQFVYSFIKVHIKNPTTNILKMLTNLGGASFVISFTIILIGIIKNKKYTICMVANLVGVTVLNQILKFMVQRPRPEESYQLIKETGFSFPSGHSMASMAFYGLLMYFVYKKIEHRKLKWLICIVLMIVILTIGMSRIYLGVHYASDVLAGFCLSILYLILFIKIVIPKILK